MICLALSVKVRCGLELLLLVISVYVMIQTSYVKYLPPPQMMVMSVEAV